MIGRLFTVGGFTVLSRIAGFFRDILMAAVMGAGPMSDAFFVALRVPNHFRAVFAEGAFSAAFVPRYAEKATLGGVAGGSRAALFADDVFSWQITIQLAILVAAIAFMPLVVGVLAPGFAGNPEQMALAVTLTRITFPYLLCIAIVTQLSTMLNAIGKFRAGAAAPIFLNLSMLATLAAAPWFPSAAYAAAYGVLAAGLLQLAFLLWAAAGSGLHLRFRRPRMDSEMRIFFRGLGAATIGAGGVQIGLFVDTIIASFLAAGDLTALYYADRVNQLPMGIIGVALGIVLLPEMSAKLAARDEKGASLAQNRAVILGLLLTLPCVAAFLLIPETVMRALFARGAFGTQAADTAATALMAYAVGLPAFLLLRCIVPSFYARHDTATPMRATLISVAANVAIKLVLVWGLSLGIAGLALGTSLAAWINIGLLVAFARRRGILVATPELRKSVLPVAAATLAAGLGFFAGNSAAGDLLAGGMLMREEGALLAAIVTAALCYAAAILIFRSRLPSAGLGFSRSRPRP